MENLTEKRQEVKDNFKRYLGCVAVSNTTGQNLDSAVNNYCSHLESKIFDYSPNEWKHIKSLYDIVDYQEIKKIQEKLLSSKEFIDKDTNTQRHRSNSLLQYVNFLEWLQTHSKDELKELEAKSTKRKLEEENKKNTFLQKGSVSWVLPINYNKYKIFDYLTSNKQLDWPQSRLKEARINDTIFIYIKGDNYRCILYKAKLIEKEIPFKDSIDDKMYWPGDNKPKEKYARLEIVGSLESNKILSVEQIGVKGGFGSCTLLDMIPEALTIVNNAFDNTGNDSVVDKEDNPQETDKISKVNEDIANTDNPRYWIYAPGEQASKWSDCTANQIMCIAWEELGDLTKYESREDMVKALKEAYGKPNASYMHDSLALWQFVHDMKPGDVIYAKKGVKNVIGRGVVMDEYVFDEEADNYNNIRKVKWTNVGNWKVNFDRQLPLKTLTRIDTNDQEFADDIEALFAEKKTIKQDPFDISSLISAIKSTNLIYDDTLIKRFAYSLLTKPFVILSGLAGSGKTQLALACAKALVEDVDSQICFVSVGADWTNREPLLGFPNALKDDVYQTPESGALQLMIEAEGNPEKPYFLILDEMNLSYVERYFADFLSAMEAKDMKIKLWDKDACGVPPAVSLPKNLFIVGTINVDETTYMFSPKVLDRANVIEFKVSEEDMVSFLDSAPDVNMLECEGKAANMAKDFVRIATDSKAISKDANDVLKKFFKELKTVNAEFGYRTATEIGRFISLATENDSMALNDAVDAAIVQKLLPKLHGSRKKMIDVLRPLFKLCLKDGNSAELEKVVTLDESICKYPISADKIHRMYKIAIDNGYTSFAEA